MGFDLRSLPGINQLCLEFLLHFLALSVSRLQRGVDRISGCGWWACCIGFTQLVGQSCTDRRTDTVTQVKCKSEKKVLKRRLLLF